MIRPIVRVHAVNIHNGHYLRTRKRPVTAPLSTRWSLAPFLNSLFTYSSLLSSWLLSFPISANFSSFPFFWLFVSSLCHSLSHIYLAMPHLYSLSLQSMSLEGRLWCPYLEWRTSPRCQIQVQFVKYESFISLRWRGLCYYKFSLVKISSSSLFFSLHEHLLYISFPFKFICIVLAFLPNVVNLSSYLLSQPPIPHPPSFQLSLSTYLIIVPLPPTTILLLSPQFSAI